jgi:hypothetical protein
MPHAAALAITTLQLAIVMTAQARVRCLQKKVKRFKEYADPLWWMVGMNS